MVDDAVAVITVHGIADQQPGQTVRELVRLLCNGRDGAPPYVDGELHEVIVPVSALAPGGASGSAATPAPAVDPDSTRGRMQVLPGRPSDFYVKQHASYAREPGKTMAAGDLGLALTDHLLAQYRPAQRDGLYSSTRASLRRRTDGTRVDVYELYWADYSRLQPGGIRALSATYQLLFHLNTLARDVVDQVALATGGGRALRLLQWLHAWSAWLLKGPAALLQLALLLLVAFGMSAFVPLDEVRFVLALGGSVAAIVLAIGAWLATQRTDGAATVSHALPWTVGALACAGLAVAALSEQVPLLIVYLLAAVLLVAVAGALLVLRYARTVRDVQAVGLAVLLATVALLLFNAQRDFTHATTLYEWLLTAALHSGEYLLAALLAVWGLLVVVQMGALALSFALAHRGAPGVAASLSTARIGLSISTALFVMLSLVLWSVIGYVIGLALKDLLFVPALLGDGYRSAAIFFEAQLTDVGTLFTPLMALAGVVGTIALVAIAPSLREEVSPAPVQPTARDDALSARLGHWWSRAQRVLAGLFGVGVPLLALASGAVYLLFLLEKLVGLPGLLGYLGALGVTWGAVLVSVGKWLAGGAVTLTALGARFTQTFGKLRVALDAVLDVDNYFLDPHDHLPPRARIYSRFAALLDYVRQRGYARVVIVAHSQGTVISADLLHYLHRSGRLAAATGGLPIALMTVGSPLRDLYAARFPLLYRWMGGSPSSFAEAGPAAAQLGLGHWVNAFRAGDYVGRAIWSPATDDTLFKVARVDEQGRVLAARLGDRSEFCLGAGAHTHYFADDAVALAAELDRLIAAGPVPPPAKT
ncbi:MAG: hypothetical protein U5L03_04415 [Burkholderiaceae bacterium]|nr:hypothetical protein [Burkholderiaceae bacterium]